eukprot:4485287-Amphidinium_carterae.1
MSVKRWEYIDTDSWIQTTSAGDCGFFYSAPDRDDDTYYLSITRFFSPQGGLLGTNSRPLYKHYLCLMKSMPPPAGRLT